MDREKFKFYLMQDYQYLLRYAKVFAAVVLKCDTEELMTRFSTIQYYILAKEMNLHREYMAGFGVKRTANMPALDNMVLNMSDARRGKIEEIFVSGVEFEYLFRDMAYKQRMSY